MLILTEKELSLTEGVMIESVNKDTIRNYNNNTDVQTIVCSRATAKLASELNFPNLKLVQLTSAGFDNVPVEEYKKRGIYVANAGTVYSAPIAETVIHGMLMMAKRYRKNPNNRIFRLTRGYKYITELLDKKVLIMGAGSIGTNVADRLQGFGVVIDAYDPYCAEKPQYGKIIRTRDELLYTLSEYDYIISTMPDTDETKSFIDAELISKMKSTAVFINVGRRAVIDENALYMALKRKQIGGAVLDMFEKLPNPVTNKFRRLRNVIVLPSVAAISKEINERLDKHICDNINRVLKDDIPLFIVNGVQ